MSRVINPESAGKDRTRLSKAIVLAIRELAKQPELTHESRDLVAFISLALSSISNGIDASVAAWEKRGYWVKADKFRMEWMWTGDLAVRMKTAILADDWGEIANTSALVAQRLLKVTVPPGHRLGQPWVGAWEKLLLTRKK